MPRAAVSVLCPVRGRPCTLNAASVRRSVLKGTLRPAGISAPGWGSLPGTGRARLQRWLLAARGARLREPGVLPRPLCRRREVAPRGTAGTPGHPGVGSRCFRGGDTLWAWVGMRGCHVCGAGRVRVCVPAQVLASCLGGAATCLAVSLSAWGQARGSSVGLVLGAMGAGPGCPAALGAARVILAARGNPLLPGVCGDVPQLSGCLSLLPEPQ